MDSPCLKNQGYHLLLVERQPAIFGLLIKRVKFGMVLTIALLAASY